MEAGRVRDGTGGVGVSADADGIVAEVKLLCEAKPSRSLVSAATETYNRFKSQNR